MIILPSAVKVNAALLAIFRNQDTRCPVVPTVSNIGICIARPAMAWARTRACGVPIEGLPFLRDHVSRNNIGIAITIASCRSALPCTCRRRPVLPVALASHHSAGSEYLKPRNPSVIDRAFKEATPVCQDCTMLSEHDKKCNVHGTEAMRIVLYCVISTHGLESASMPRFACEI